MCIVEFRLGKQGSMSRDIARWCGVCCDLVAEQVHSWLPPCADRLPPCAGHLQMSRRKQHTFMYHRYKTMGKQATLGECLSLYNA